MDQIRQVGSLLPQKYRVPFNGVLNFVQVMQLIQEKLMPEYEERKKNEEHDHEDPQAFSCIFEGSERVEINKRKSIKIIKEGLIAFQKFIDKIDIDNTICQQKIIEAFYDVETSLIKIDLNVIAENQNQFKIEYQITDPALKLNSSMNELANIGLEYFKYQYLKDDLRDELVSQQTHIRDQVYRLVRKKAKSKRYSQYKKLEEFPHLFLNESAQNDYLKYITTQKLSLIDIPLHIHNFLQENNKYYQDCIKDLNAFPITETISIKYLQKTNEFLTWEIKNSLKPHYTLNANIEQFIRDKLIFYLKQYFDSQGFQGGVLDQQTNKALQFTIYQVYWKTKFQQEVAINLLQKLGSMNLPVDQQFYQNYQTENYLYHFMMNHKQSIEEMESWYFENVNEESNFKILLQLYLLVNNILFVNGQLNFSEYKPVQRDSLILLFRYVNNCKYSYLNMHILKIIESLFGQINKQALESMASQYNLTEEGLLRQNPQNGFQFNFQLQNVDFQVTLKQKPYDYFKQNRMIYLLQKPLIRQDDYVKKLTLLTQPVINKMLQEIKQEYLKTIPLPEIMLFEMISSQNASNVITLCISGFITEDENKFDQWSGMVQQNGSMVIALHWKCSKLSDLGTYILKQGFEVFLSRLMMNPAALISQGIDIYQNNPFQKAEKEASSVGKYLAYLIGVTKIFGNCAINLVGHSLGTQIIHDCIRELDKLHVLNKEIYINQVLLMGGAADCYKLAKRRWHSVSGNIYNIYSHKDDVLKYILQVLKIFNTPCGIYFLIFFNKKKERYREVINCDFTKLIEGHKHYKKMLQDILIQTDFDHDFKSFFVSTDIYS